MLRYLLWAQLLLSPSVTLAKDYTSKEMRDMRNTDGKYPPDFPSGLPGFSIEHNEKPNWTFDDDTDIGGYKYHGMYIINMDDWDFEKWGAMCYCCDPIWNPARYIFGNKYAIAGGITSIETYNCSNVHEKEKISGTINSAKICNAGDCCSDYWGGPRRNEDYDKRTLQYETMLKGGLCGNPTEDQYCIFMLGMSQIMCLQMYTSPLGRAMPLIPCADHMYDFWSGCPVYKAEGMEDVTVANTEPPSYNAKLSPTDQLVFKAVVDNPDKLCVPHSYYTGDEGTAGDDDQESSSSSLVLLASFFLLM